jgi:TATA-box binding protein (TBP) (component of TFIID and TFIIIB)
MSAYTKRNSVDYKMGYLLGVLRGKNNKDWSLEDYILEANNIIEIKKIQLDITLAEEICNYHSYTYGIATYKGVDFVLMDDSNYAIYLYNDGKVQLLTIKEDEELAETLKKLIDNKC